MVMHTLCRTHSFLGQRMETNMNQALMHDSYTPLTSMSRQEDDQGTLRIYKVANFMDQFWSSMLKYEEV